MATYIYNGSDEREFPTLVLTVKPGDTFDAPDGLDVADVSLASGKKSAPVVPVAPVDTPAPSAPSDSTVGA
jgi:hypothetical protein